MSTEDTHRATDAESHIAARLDVVQGGGGGASAVTVELTNTSAADEVVLKVNATLSAFITLTVTDAQGGVLSKPARKFSSAERQAFERVRLAPGEARRWRVPLTEQLDASMVPDAGLQGRLIVNVLLLFRTATASSSGQAGDEAFASSILTLSDMDVTFTRAALSEGASPSRNGH